MLRFLLRGAAGHAGARLDPRGRGSVGSRHCVARARRLGSETMILRLKIMATLIALLLSACSGGPSPERSEEHTSELQSQSNLVCRLLLEKKKKTPVFYHLTIIQSDTVHRIA